MFFFNKKKEYNKLKMYKINYTYYGDSQENIISAYNEHEALQKLYHLLRFPHRCNNMSIKEYKIEKEEK